VRFVLLLAVLWSSRGPSTTVSPYVVPVVPEALTISLLTAGDSVDGYRLAGRPDGLGAFDNGDGTFTLLMHHESGTGLGATRGHGAPGAFVSKWIIRRHDLRVLRGEDLIRQIAVWNRSTLSYETPAKGVRLANLCSATFVPSQGLFFSGEEISDGRAFAHTLDGTSYELARLGRAQWENAVMHPSAPRTIVIGLDDTSDGYVYVYVGDRRSSGTAVERAGLMNGTISAVDIPGVPRENAQSGIPSGSAFVLRNLGNPNGGTLRPLSAAVGATRWQRPEDGSWDPAHPRDFYFVTTATLDGHSRLWRLRFDSLEFPGAGGTLDMLLDGTEGPKMMDNIAVRASGDVIIQEDPAGSPLPARLWRYDIAGDRVELIAELTSPGGESSGVIDVSDLLGEGWLLLDVQTHTPAAGEIVEGGQLLAMRLPVRRRRSTR
jgi:hypothetical protein